MGHTSKEPGDVAVHGANQQGAKGRCCSESKEEQSTSAANRGIDLEVRAC
jgi:hypothetical protein